MPEVPSQAASHAICQAVSHMDLLIKRGERERGKRREAAAGAGGKGALNTPTLFCCILSPVISLRYKDPEYLEHIAVILF